MRTKNLASQDERGAKPKKRKHHAKDCEWLQSWKKYKVLPGNACNCGAFQSCPHCQKVHGVDILTCGRIA